MKQPTQAESTELALAELGDFAVSELPEGYTEAGVSGAPTSEGGGWYGYVRRKYENAETNSIVTFFYETYRLGDGEENTAENVLARFPAGSPLEVNGFNGSISTDGTSVYWVDTERSVVFGISSGDITGEELIAMANSVQ